MRPRSDRAAGLADCRQQDEPRGEIGDQPALYVHLGSGPLAAPLRWRHRPSSPDPTDSSSNGVGLRSTPRGGRPRWWRGHEVPELPVARVTRRYAPCTRRRAAFPSGRRATRPQDGGPTVPGEHAESPGGEERVPGGGCRMAVLPWTRPPATGPTSSGTRRPACPSSPSHGRCSRPPSGPTDRAFPSAQGPRGHTHGGATSGGRRLVDRRPCPNSDHPYLLTGEKHMRSFIVTGTGYQRSSAGGTEHHHFEADSARAWAEAPQGRSGE